MSDDYTPGRSGRPAGRVRARRASGDVFGGIETGARGNLNPQWVTELLLTGSASVNAGASYSYQCFARSGNGTARGDPARHTCDTLATGVTGVYPATIFTDRFDSVSSSTGRYYWVEMENR